MKLQINNCGCHFSTNYSLKELIDTPRRQVYLYTLITIVLLEINSKEIFQKENCWTYKSVHFIVIFNKGKKESIYMPKGQGRQTNLQPCKRFKTDINLPNWSSCCSCCLPQVTSLAWRQFPQAQSKEFSSTQNPQWSSISFKSKIQSSDHCLRFTVASATSLISSSLISLCLLAYSKGQVHWVVSAYYYLSSPERMNSSLSSGLYSSIMPSPFPLPCHSLYPLTPLYSLRISYHLTYSVFIVYGPSLLFYRHELMIARTLFYSHNRHFKSTC